MLTDEPLLELPARPAHARDREVVAWREPVEMRSYLPLEPSRFPAYLDARVYQGSSGRVYPLPFHDRIAAEPVVRAWDAVHLENAWIRLMVLPELGGRIHIAVERSTGSEVFYRNPVIKPALVGLAGPWIAGGIELNWPQHHRPATFLPTDVEIEEESDGSVTVWCSDHDPFQRMKGMHGVRLSPGRSTIELRVRLYNRSATTQTFLWWANVAARAGADYQSFFPEDVQMVADHAKRAICTFPAADRPYYDIDYPARRDRRFTSPDGTVVTGDRLDWYRNIPVPTSYMVLHSDQDFFGGYDHASDVGFVHVADRQLAVGKKMWTWGDSDFGRAWGRNLADDDSAYVELMAGVFADNQPDFSFIAPGETKVFSELWYPLLRIGPADRATSRAAVRLTVTGRRVRVGVVTTQDRAGTVVELLDAFGDIFAEHAAAVDPGSPLVWETSLPDGVKTSGLTVRVRHAGNVLVEYTSEPVHAPEEDPEPAAEPPAPQDVTSVEELVGIGDHLEQYRHATRSPEPYWEEAVRRDPGHSRAHTSLGIRRLRQGRTTEAEQHLRQAVGRLTRYHPTAQDTTALYHLGLVLEGTGRHDDAYDAFGRASWSRLWRAPAGYQMARIDASRARDPEALHRLTDVLRTEPEHLQARTLRALLLRRTGRAAEAERLLAGVRELDPLHWWSRDLAGEPLTCDAQTCLDVALEYAGIGEVGAALRVLSTAVERESTRALGQTAAGPLLELHRAALHARLGDTEAEREALEGARTADRSWCFPGRLTDAEMLTGTSTRHPEDPTSRALLGHWLYAEGRHQDAIRMWRESAALDPGDAVVWRNLGLASFNDSQDADAAREAYDHALDVAPDDARLVFESDQLDRRRRVAPDDRLRSLESVRDLVGSRDDLSVELAHLLVSNHRAEEAHRFLLSRHFQPWEGGEGEVLRVWERACLTLAGQALSGRDVERAAELVEEALDSPESLGEARHPLATMARLHLLRGDIASSAGRSDEAERAWSLAATQVGDFRSMSAQRHSETSYHCVLALRRLGRDHEASALMEDLAAFVDELEASRAGIGYFATSLPQLLLLRPDPLELQRDRARFLRAQLELLRGDHGAATAGLEALLMQVPDHADALDLLTELREGSPT